MFFFFFLTAVQIDLDSNLILSLIVVVLQLTDDGIYQLAFYCICCYTYK